MAFLDETGLTTLVGHIKNEIAAVVPEGVSAIDAYPVGAVYISYNSTSPASLFGGTWTAITGRFPYFNAGTGTGGSNTHTLTESELPKLTGTFDVRNWTWGGTSNAPGAFWPSGIVSTATGESSGQDLLLYGSNTGGTTRVSIGFGGGSSHNNMPAYQTLYAWRRTA